MTNDAEREDLDRRAFALRTRSESYDEIGRQLGVSPTEASEAVERALRSQSQSQSTLDEVRAQELAKLDVIEQRVREVIERGGASA